MFFSKALPRLVLAVAVFLAALPAAVSADAPVGTSPASPAGQIVDLHRPEVGIDSICVDTPVGTVPPTGASFAVSPNGTRHAVWRENVSGLLCYSSQTAVGAWTSPAEPVSYGHGQFVLATSDNGVHVGFSNRFAGDDEAYYVTRSGGQWGLPTNMAYMSGGADSDVSLAERWDGQLVASWRHRLGETHYHCVLAEKGGWWWATQPLETPSGCIRPRRFAIGYETPLALTEPDRLSGLPVRWTTTTENGTMAFATGAEFTVTGLPITVTTGVPVTVEVRFQNPYALPIGAYVELTGWEVKSVVPGDRFTVLETGAAEIDGIPSDGAFTVVFTCSNPEGGATLWVNGASRGLIRATTPGQTTGNLFFPFVVAGATTGTAQSARRPVPVFREVIFAED